MCRVLSVTVERVKVVMAGRINATLVLAGDCTCGRRASGARGGSKVEAGCISNILRSRFVCTFAEAAVRKPWENLIVGPLEITALGAAAMVRGDVFTPNLGTVGETIPYETGHALEKVRGRVPPTLNAHSHWSRRGCEVRASSSASPFSAGKSVPFAGEKSADFSQATWRRSAALRQSRARLPANSNAQLPPHATLSLHSDPFTRPLESRIWCGPHALQRHCQLPKEVHLASRAVAAMVLHVRG